MNPIQKNIYIDCGSTFTATMAVKRTNGQAFDLTGYTARSQLRKSTFSKVAYDVTATVSSPATSGIVTLSMTAEQTSAVPEGRYLYDLEIVSSSSGIVYRTHSGIASVSGEVTR